MSIESIASESAAAVAGALATKASIAFAIVAAAIGTHKGLYNVRQGTGLVTEYFGKFHKEITAPGLTWVNPVSRVVWRPNLREIVQECQVKSQDKDGLTYIAFGNFSYKISHPAAAWYAYQNPGLAETAIRAIVESHIQQQMVEHSYDDARKDKSALQDAIVKAANKDLGPIMRDGEEARSHRGYEVLTVTLKDLVPGDDFILASDQKANAKRLVDAAESRGAATSAEIKKLSNELADQLVAVRAKLTEFSGELADTAALTVLTAAVAASSAGPRVTLVSMPGGGVKAAPVPVPAG
jgi:regulator of protease activity HflC (stomatin/prohibitin superfamily)